MVFSNPITYYKADTKYAHSTNFPYLAKLDDLMYTVATTEFEIRNSQPLSIFLQIWSNSNLVGHFTCPMSKSIIVYYIVPTYQN